MRWAVLLITPNSFQNKFGVSYFKQNEVSIEYHSALFLLHPFNQKGEAETKLLSEIFLLDFVSNHLTPNLFQNKFEVIDKTAHRMLPPQVLYERRLNGQYLLDRIAVT
eukprot:TRINITY_DN4510_c0_g1_i1.p1 TRINITY_DN4510_c0_g1~~TRINITY_DN4510_c0_g1_i1.p1  ORF type:complete len:108 (+),score=6.91 TRINITY_DN4510_c0_g1_i1:1-324(+)